MYAPDPNAFASADAGGPIVAPGDVGGLHPAAAAGYGAPQDVGGPMHHAGVIQHPDVMVGAPTVGHAMPLKKRSLDNGDFDRDGLNQSLKRQQIDGQATRVLLLRNLARGVTELDVASFVQPFTKTSKPKIYLQASAGHAFVEFADEDTATAALQYFRQHPIMLKGSSVMVTYSKRDAVTTLEEKQDPFYVVLVSVTNMYYEVDIELMHFLFSKHGQVEKIVTFRKPQTMCQALIQFKHSDQAKAAMLALHNRNIYDGCNTLQIQPSKLKQLDVKENNDKSWDYTVNAAGPPPSSGNDTDSRAGLPIYNSPMAFPGMQPGMPAGGGAPAPTARGVNNYYPQQRPGMVMGTGGPSNNMMSALDKLPKELRKLNLETSNPSQTPVVICYNLPTAASIDKLFNLFSLYGSVLRIKILRDKPDTALIQYSDPLYATIAQSLLQNVDVMGNELQVSLSRKSEVKLPSNTGDAVEEERRTQAFSVKEQRYGGHDVDKYMRGICRPTRTIFVANISEDVNDEQLTKLFSQFGSVKKFQFRPPKTETTKLQTAMLELDTVSDAITALMHLHNYEINGRSLKVAFSKTIMP